MQQYRANQGLGTRDPAAGLVEQIRTLGYRDPEAHLAERPGPSVSRCAWRPRRTLLTVKVYYVRTRRRAWRRAQDLLRAAVHGVHAPRVGEEGHAAQRAHRVHQQQRAVRVAQLAQPRQVLVHARAAVALRAWAAPLHHAAALHAR